ncbi:MAG: hypothetical protein R8J84_08170 [Mariprofundales bacterium]
MITAVIEAVALQIRRATQAAQALDRFLAEIDADAFEDFSRLAVMDSFVFRLIKVQDMMGERLFRALLVALAEDRDAMTMLDVLDRLEKLGLIPSAQQWLDYRNLRNVLTHEYPENSADRIDALRAARLAFDDIEAIFHRMVEAVSERGLLK